MERECCCFAIYRVANPGLVISRLHPFCLPVTWAWDHEITSELSDLVAKNHVCMTGAWQPADRSKPIINDFMNIPTLAFLQPVFVILYIELNMTTQQMWISEYEWMSLFTNLQTDNYERKRLNLYFVWSIIYQFSGCHHHQHNLNMCQTETWHISSLKSICYDCAMQVKV